jgi:hypothetical protein
MKRMGYTNNMYGFNGEMSLRILVAGFPSGTTFFFFIKSGPAPAKVDVDFQTTLSTKALGTLVAVAVRVRVTAWGEITKAPTLTNTERITTVRASMMMTALLLPRGLLQALTVG